MYLQDWNFSWSPACNLLPIVTVSKYVVQNYLNEALRLQVFVLKANDSAVMMLSKNVALHFCRCCVQYNNTSI
jgi:hypothetical protein